MALVQSLAIAIVADRTRCAEGSGTCEFFDVGLTPPRKPTRNQLQEICDAVSDNAMPPRAYRVMHPEARLSLQVVNALCDWADMANSLSQSRTDEP